MVKDATIFERHLTEVIDKTWNYAGRCVTSNDHLSNAVFGMSGEAGEVADQVKKMLYHTEKPYEFHREKLVSELGDVLFYMIKFMQLTGITVEEALQDNARKLASRHPELGQVTERFGEGYIK
jgi:NTP pyrophosphatase (non-canonical NTP hydrolase)